MIAVGYHDNVNVLQNVGAAYEGPFDRPEWFALIAAHDDARPLVVTAGTQEAMMALPLVERNGRLEPLVNWYSFTWRPAGNTGVPEQLAGAIAKALQSRTARVTLWPLPDEDGSAALLAKAFRRAGWWARLDKCDDNHILRTNGRSFAEYLAQRPGPIRTTLKRKARKIDVNVFTSFDDVAWKSYEKIYASSWKPAEGRPAVLKAFAEQEGAAGRLRLGIALHEGRPVAAQFWTVEGGTAWIHKLAHLEEAQPLSAGTTLTAALFEHVIDHDGVQLIDFGTGNDPYKRDWMEENRPRYQLDCHNPARLASWPHIARAMFHRLRKGASVARGPS